MPNSLKHAANLAVATFGQRDLVPAVGPFAATGFKGRELGNAIIQRDAFEQAFFLFIA